jgi:hypothetical protein
MYSEGHETPYEPPSNSGTAYQAQFFCPDPEI